MPTFLGEHGPRFCPLPAGLTVLLLALGQEPRQGRPPLLLMRVARDRLRHGRGRAQDDADRAGGGAEQTQAVDASSRRGPVS